MKNTEAPTYASGKLRESLDKQPRNEFAELVAPQDPFKKLSMGFSALSKSAPRYFTLSLHQYLQV